MALAVTGSSRDPQAVFSRSARHLFLVPWRGGTLVGVWHARVGWGSLGDAGRGVGAPGVDRGDQRRHARPRARAGGRRAHPVRTGAVRRERAGSLGSQVRPSIADRRSRASGRGGGSDHPRVGPLHDCANRGSPGHGSGLPEAGAPRRPPAGPGRPACSGGISSASTICVREVRRDAGDCAPAGGRGRPWRTTTGATTRRFSRLLAKRKGPMLLVPGSTTLEAEILHAVRREAARTLSDVVLRRTDLGAAGHPGAAALEAAATLMAKELHWDATRRQKELDVTSATFPALTS